MCYSLACLCYTVLQVSIELFVYYDSVNDILYVFTHVDL